MRKVIAVFLVFGWVGFSFAKEKQDKTFLILFNEHDLKKEYHMEAHLELTFLESFQARAYGGNSDAAILVKVSDTSYTTRDMGSSMVLLGNGKVLELDKIASRIIDLSECSDNFKAMVKAGNPESPKLAKKKQDVSQIVVLTF
jgi:hypothetical protein